MSNAILATKNVSLQMAPLYATKENIPYRLDVENDRHSRRKVRKRFSITPANKTNEGDGCLYSLEDYYGETVLYLKKTEGISSDYMVTFLI